MVMLLGTACPEVTESLAKVVPYWNIIQVKLYVWGEQLRVCLDIFDLRCRLGVQRRLSVIATSFRTFSER